MEAIVSLCKRRGFVFPSSEIYGGINGFFDYGPLGAELKKNIRDCWWSDLVRRRDDVVGLESSIIMHPKVWEASGHVAGFTDPLVDCKVSKQRYRADQLFFSAIVVDGQVVGYVSALESAQTAADLQAAAESFKRKKAIQGKLDPVQPRDMTEAKPEEVALIPSPATGEPGSLTPPRSFNMMFQTNVGALTDASSVAYLRPETAQGMFVDFKNVTDTGRVKLPFGIAQIGKSFRNEITPRNFIFRSREFEQMEMEYFIHEDADWAKCHREWIDWCRQWLGSIGLPESHLSEYNHPKEKLAFYSKGTTDIMFRFPFGVQELWGIAARGNYDLSQHAKVSGVPQEIFDEAAKKRFTPHVIEPAVGVDRIFLAVLCAAYAEEEVRDEKGGVEKRTVLRLSPRIAPVKVAVLPLLKNKPELTARAREIHGRLKRNDSSREAHLGAASLGWSGLGQLRAGSQVVEKVSCLNPQRFGDDDDPAATNAIRTELVFMDLLIGQTDPVGQFLLGQPDRLSALADAAPYDQVDLRNQDTTAQDTHSPARSCSASRSP